MLDGNWESTCCLLLSRLCFFFISSHLSRLLRCFVFSLLTLILKTHLRHKSMGTCAVTEQLQRKSAFFSSEPSLLKAALWDVFSSVFFLPRGTATLCNILYYYTGMSLSDRTVYEQCNFHRSPLTDHFYKTWTPQYFSIFTIFKCTIA